MRYLKNRISYLYRHRFIRNTATLGGGTLVGNLVQGVVGIVLARLLQPELFGVYALALSLSSDNGKFY